MVSFRETDLRYIDSLTQLGHILVSGISLDLGLLPDHFQGRYIAHPLILFRIFDYPPATERKHAVGVGEHTDSGGLQVKSHSGWMKAPPIPGDLCLQHRRYA